MGRDGSPEAPTPLDELLTIHADVDAAVDSLSRRHAARLQCRRGCSACCVDDLTVFEVEAARIREFRRAHRDDEPPRAPGACAFLTSEDACRIYEARPYVCRTQGMPLRWIDDESGAAVEYRDICPLNDGDEPLESLSADECWTLGPAEGRLAALQVRSGGEPPARLALRDLFHETST